MKAASIAFLILAAASCFAAASNIAAERARNPEPGDLVMYAIGAFLPAIVFFGLANWFQTKAKRRAEAGAASGDPPPPTAGGD